MTYYRKWLIMPAMLFLSLTACIAVVDNEIQDDAGISEAERMAREDNIPVRGETPGRVCTTDRLGSYVGKAATATMGSDIVRDANAASLRWIRPSDAVTMDYRRDRINVKLTEEIVVTGFSCG